MRLADPESDSALPLAGWMLYDGGFGFCFRWVHFWKKVVGRRGFALKDLHPLLTMAAYESRPCDLEPPCVPSRGSATWRIRLAIYAGIALSATAYLLLRIAILLERLRISVNRLLPLLLRESPSRHRHLLAVLPRSSLMKPRPPGRSPSLRVHPHSPNCCWYLSNKIGNSNCR